MADLKRGVEEAWSKDASRQAEIEKEFEKIEKAKDDSLPGAADTQNV